MRERGQGGQNETKSNKTHQGGTRNHVRHKERLKWKEEEE